MISIIISSARKEMLSAVSENIMNTIGIPYELLTYDNAGGRESICSIYNKGATLAKFEVLCFMHEDIFLKTKDWGNTVVKCFNDNKKLGVLGVVGSAYKSKSPSGWGADSAELKIHHYNYIQRFSSNRPPKHYFENPSKAEVSNVVSVDGMWFCTTREIWKENLFDEDIFNGFHCYDLDYCFQVGQKYDVAVTFKILMEHFSEGGYTRQWWESTLKLHEKWNEILPVAIEKLSDRHSFLIEKRAYRWIIEKLLEMGYSRNYVNKFLINEIIKRNIGFLIYLKAALHTMKYYKSLTSKNTSS